MRSADLKLFVAWERQERPYPWTEKSFEETLSENVSRTLVYENEQGVVGFAVVQVVDDEAYLSNMMIDPACRRKGEGFKLLQKIMIWSKKNGAMRMLLDVDPINTIAVKLYTNAGFEVLEHRKHSYPNGEDAILMEKKL